MSIQVQRVKSINPKTGEDVWQVRVKGIGVVDSAQLAEEISARTGIHEGVVSCVVNAVWESAEKYIKLGHAVRMGNVATLRPSVSCPNVVEEKDCTARNIRGMKIVCMPHGGMRVAMEQMHYEMMGGSVEADGDEDDGTVPSGGGGGGAVSPGDGGGSQPPVSDDDGLIGE